MSKFILSFSDADIIQNSKIILSKVSIDVLPGEFVFLIARTVTGKISIIIHSYSYYPIPMNEQFLLNHLKTFKSGQSINLTSKV